jgi:hypothetical protein
MLSPRDPFIDLHGRKRYTNIIEKENEQTKMSNPPRILNCIDFVKQSQWCTHWARKLQNSKVFFSNFESPTKTNVKLLQCQTLVPRKCASDATSSNLLVENTINEIKKTRKFVPQWVKTQLKEPPK